MGSSVSRGASKTARQFPGKADVSSRLQPTTGGPTARSAPTTSAYETEAAPATPTPRQPSAEKSEAIMRDAQDPDFDSMLRTLGAVRHTNNPNLPPMPSSSHTVQPLPSASASPSQLPTSLLIMRARERQSFIQSTDPDSYMTVFTLREVIALRQRGNKTDEEIERLLKLKKGTLSRLGNSVGPVAMRDERTKERVDFIG